MLSKTERGERQIDGEKDGNSPVWILDVTNELYGLENVSI